MRRSALTACLAVAVVACGGSAGTPPAEVPAAERSPSPATTTPLTSTPTATPVATATPQPTPTASPVPTPTVDPTLVADVRSDADVDRSFVGMAPDELRAIAKETGDASYNLPLPFDPHGVRFQLRTQAVRWGTDSAPFQVFGVVLLSGSVTLKLHGPAVYAMRREILFEIAGPRYLIVPTDQDVFRQPMAFQMGTRGVFVEATLASEVIAPNRFGEVGAPATQFGSGMGTAVLRVDASMPPLGGPVGGIWPRSHILIHGAGLNGYKDGAPLTEKSLLRAPDGRIVYIRCEFRFDGAKWIQACP